MTDRPLRCTYCGVALSIDDQTRESCGACGKVFSIIDLQNRLRDLEIQDRQHRQDGVAEKLGAVIGALSLLVGVILVVASPGGVGLLLSKTGMAAAACMVLAVVHYRLNDAPLYQPLLAWGITVLIFGIFAATVL